MKSQISSSTGVGSMATASWRGVWCGLAMVSVLGGFNAAAAQTQGAKKGAAPVANATLKSCSWDRPGKDPYMGELPSAVDRYIDLSPEVRTKLKDRIAKQQYDDVVEIKRDAIVGSGKFVYASQIRDMHFGDKGRMCSTVTRQRWTSTTTERGLVYCESGQCVMVPTVCRNVSRVAARPVAVAEKGTGAPAAAPPAEAPTPVAAKPEGVAPAPAPTPTPAFAGGPGPTFADVAQGPVFAFPSGPSGTSSTVVVGPPPGSTGGTGGGTTPPPTVGGGTVDPGTPPPVVVVPPDTGIPPGVLPPGTGIPPVVVPPDTGTPPVVIPPGTGIPPGVSPPGGGVVGGESVVTPIPEPSTWALMVGGLFLVGVMARRRRVNAV